MISCPRSPDGPHFHQDHSDTTDEMDSAVPRNRLSAELGRWIGQSGASARRRLRPTPQANGTAMPREGGRNHGPTPALNEGEICFHAREQSSSRMPICEMVRSCF